MRVPVFFLLLMAVALIGCGTPGAPLPPSLGLPKPVSDLQAVRKGDTVTLTWSAPTETSDGELIRKPGKMQLSRTVSSGGVSAGASQIITEVPLPPSLKEQQAAAPAAKDSLSSNLQQTSGGDFAVYAVLTQSRSGKSA